eukprot:TRINITY_DN21330_c0_g1_i1.p1 TRINITY_DN21330_c0_g1~~TRINITY_DN21330_c0_g1_i1.p1  ORF type:complete len:380 (+),score=33.68 TRINITY_DN21330_c0_g1_i1:60-1142(+)
MSLVMTVMTAAIGVAVPKAREAAVLSGFEPYVSEAAIGIEYCTVDRDCQRFGDTSGSCGASKVCQCGTGYTGKTCYKSGEEATANFYFVVTFPKGDCDGATAGVAVNYFSNVFPKTVSGANMLCSPGVMIVIQTDSFDATTVSDTAIAYRIKAHEVASTLSYLNHAINATPPRMIVTVAGGQCDEFKATRVVDIDGVCRVLECASGYEAYTGEVHGNPRYACGMFTEKFARNMSSLKVAGIIVGFVAIAFFVTLIFVRFGRKKKTPLELRKDAAKEFQASFSSADNPRSAAPKTPPFHPLPQPDTVSPTGYPYGATPLPPVTRNMSPTTVNIQPTNDEHEPYGTEEGYMREATTFIDCEV